MDVGEKYKNVVSKACGTFTNKDVSEYSAQSRALEDEIWEADERLKDEEDERCSE